MTGALARYTYLSHIYRVRDKGLTEKDKSDAEDVVGRMVRRVPVTVELTNRTVTVTGRSYNAMMEIARHSLRLQEIEAELLRLSDLVDVCVKRAEDGERHVRRLARKRLGWLTRLHRRLLMETALHRQALYAHALTDSGAPAKRIGDAPSWWIEMTPEDDSLLLSGMFKVGHERLVQLNELVDDGRDDPERKSKRQSFGWHTLFTSLERSSKVAPAEYYDRDLFQLTAWAQASAPAAYDLDDE